MSPRLSLAAQDGALPLYEGGRVLLMHPPADLDLATFGEAQVSIVQNMMPDVGKWQARGVPVSPDMPDGSFDVAIVFMSRIKTLARTQIADASQAAARVVVDGQKTDGVESMYRDIRRRAEASAAVSKAHGKLFWFETGEDFSDWRSEPSLLDGRWHVAPGVFSADGVDPGSRQLADALPVTLSGQVADLGAGWGYVSATALARCPKIDTLHLVEAFGPALDNARQNVTDPRAMFHWADATTWAGAKGLDAVIMNPPFHKGRAAQPDLGRAFISAAGRLLRPGGSLWMVANRHLAYEQVLRDVFADVNDVGGDTRYKLLHAVMRSKPRRRT